jgi:glutamyl/glutaminyl-tRNA synthetase
MVMRIEDIDTPRVVQNSEARILEDLEWLGIDWDGPISRQSERVHIYEDALAKLGAKKMTYRCDCSRAEIARVASAPHVGEEAVYAGLCRDREHHTYKRDPSIRLRVPSECTIAFHDGVMGDVTERVDIQVGDFVLRRGDGVYAYQLAVTVDDAAMGITDVVRGADVLGSTSRQIFLAQCLAASVPRYMHVPLVVAADGSRLAKRTPAATIRELRDAGLSAREAIGEIAFALGITANREPSSPRDLLAIKEEPKWRRDPWPIPHAWADRSLRA